jgi:phage shock protein C
MSSTTGRRLYRSRDDRWIAGICGGLAEYTGLPVRLLRFLFFLFGWFGVGELVYIALWILIPNEPRVG